MFSEKELGQISKVALENRDYVKDFDLAHALSELSVAARMVLTLIQHPDMRIPLIGKNKI